MTKEGRHRTMPRHATLRHATPCHTMSHHTAPHHTTPHHTTPHRGNPHPRNPGNLHYSPGTGVPPPWGLLAWRAHCAVPPGAGAVGPHSGHDLDMALAARCRAAATSGGPGTLMGTSPQDVGTRPDTASHHHGVYRLTGGQNHPGVGGVSAQQGHIGHHSHGGRDGDHGMVRGATHL